MEKETIEQTYEKMISGYSELGGIVKIDVDRVLGECFDSEKLVNRTYNIKDFRKDLSRAVKWFSGIVYRHDMADNAACKDINLGRETNGRWGGRSTYGEVEMIRESREQYENCKNQLGDIERRLGWELGWNGSGIYEEIKGLNCNWID